MVYYWRVKVKTAKDSSAWSPAYNFTTTDGLLTKPVLLTPANNSVNQPLNIKLTWTAVKGTSISYKYQVDTISTFTHPIEASAGSNTNSGTALYGKLLYDKVYYWRIQTFTSTKDTSAWTSPFTFTTLNNMPQVPNLFTPANNAAAQSSTLNFLWSQTTGASIYIIQIDTLNTFNNPPVSDTISNFSKIYSNLLFGKKYFWRVKAGNANVMSDWSSVNSFTVISKPVLLSPADNLVDEPIVNAAFKWNSIKGVSGYDFQIDINSSFNSPSLVSVKLTDTVYTLNNLKFASQYFWRVRARNSKDTTGWSDVRSINTVKTVTVLYPLNNAADGQ